MKLSDIRLKVMPNGFLTLQIKNDQGQWVDVDINEIERVKHEKNPINTTNND